MIAQQLLPELNQEVAITRRHLERIPDDRFEWKPHEKSWSAGTLAGHLGHVLEWVEGTLLADHFDLAEPVTPPSLGSMPEVLEYFDGAAARAREVIEQTTDETFMGNWQMRNAGTVLFEMPRAVVIRSFILNHLIHHRGQLSVYLRLCGCAVPQTYGPTADETQM